MDKKQSVWVAIIICLIGLVFFGINKLSSPDIISVGGECLTTAPKDRTAITLRVTVTDKSAARSMRMASEQVAEINKYLKNLDVKVQTSEFNSYEKNEWNSEKHKSEFVGFETTISLDVSAANIDLIEQVLTEFAGQPNVFVTNLRMFTSAETMKPIMESCLGTAVENARDRAAALASGAGRRVGKLLSVSYGSGVTYQPTANFRVAKLAMASGAEDSYAGGAITGKDTEVSVNVSAVFEIK